jgi:hypothetical protein
VTYHPSAVQELRGPSFANENFAELRPEMAHDTAILDSFSAPKPRSG